MALLQVTFSSATLHRNGMAQVALPSDAWGGGRGPFK